MHRLLAIIAVTTMIISCSKSPDHTVAATPTGPTAIPVSAIDAGGGKSGRAVVDFPPRNEGLDFRAQLENKYLAMGRRAAQVYVDQEGDVVWIGEYYRYRVNGCDHNTATQYVMVQVDGAVAPPICAVRFFPENAVYPARDQMVDFRRQLGTKYQSLGRSAQSAVDADGVGIWMGEYFRYRTSGCDHATAVQKVMTQIDGNPAPATCLVQCAYNFATPVTAPAAGGTMRTQLIRTSGTCDWLAAVNPTTTPWLTLERPITGTDRDSVTYTVAANTGAARTGIIQVSYPGGAGYLEVNQGSPATANLGFQFFAPATSTNPTTECQLRSTATTCTLTAVTQGLPNPVATYDWRVEYSYAGSKVKTQVGASPTFSFTESCGVAPPEGSVIPITVKLVATDTAGNTGTIFSGSGTQPALQLRFFSCQ